MLRLRKIDEDYDPTDRLAAMAYIQRHHAKGEVVTGLLYIDDAPGDLHDRMNTVDTPLNRLGEEDLCPGPAALAGINAGLR